MKMVKSLLLVSAAGLVAVSGAQAADLPVKAKPVEYVKVCSLYGAGFYYVPGTDICVKIGAYIRAEYGYGNVASSLTNLDATGADGQRTRISGPDYQQRARAFLLLDSRQQTAYGTLRAYLNIGHSGDFPASNPTATSAAAVYANRAFVQLAGFTWGLATSYYDFYSSPATSFSVPWSSDTGDGGWKVAAYTAQLGNGLSASLSLEEPRRATIVNTSGSSSLNANTLAATNTAIFGVGAVALSDAAKVKFPDVVANLRVDQAWGSAQIMGALHEASGGYYGTTPSGLGAGGNAVQTTGGPSQKFGFAVGAGLRVNFPMIGPGDYFQSQFNYTQGASRYAAATPVAAGSPGIFGGNELGVGWFSDGVFCGTAATGAATATCPANGSGVELTTVWGVNAAYEHFWTPSLRTSVVGAYTDISYNGAASLMMCTAFAAQAGTGNSIGAPSNCGTSSFNWSYWSLSSRTQWNITKDFYVGLEGFYGHLNTMSGGQTAVYTASSTGNQPTGTRTLADQDVFVYRMRVHRDIVP